DGGRPQGPGRADAPPDPHPRPRLGALGGGDRVALHGHAAGGLAAPDRAQGGRARARTPQRNPPPLQPPARGARRPALVPGGLLGRAPAGAQARGGGGGEEETWKPPLSSSRSPASS